MKRTSISEEEDMLIQLSSLIDRVIITNEAEFRNTDVCLLRQLEHYMCDQLVIAKRKEENERIRKAEFVNMSDLYNE
jgi:hypothetical protein